jgi:hypothetical protein
MIPVMDGGEIVERIKYEALVQASGIYAPKTHETTPILALVQDQEALARLDKWVS